MCVIDKKKQSIYPTDQVGTVFIAKGTGTGVGAVISPKIYRSVRGNTALSVGLLLLAATLLSMPFISTVVSLHVAYFMLGVLIDMVITGCQVMTRKVHGEKSGIWIGSNMVALGTSSALVSLICFVDDSLLQQYIIFSATSLSAAAFLGVALPAPEGFEGLLEVREARRNEILYIDGEGGAHDNGRQICGWYRQ